MGMKGNGIEKKIISLNMRYKGEVARIVVDAISSFYYDPETDKTLIYVGPSTEENAYDIPGDHVTELMEAITGRDSEIKLEEAIKQLSRDVENLKITMDDHRQNTQEELGIIWNLVRKVEQEMYSEGDT